MGSTHRYTNEWPPPDMLEVIPNWEQVLVEDDNSEDETCLIPADEQECIGDFVAFSAADVTFANGETHPAMLEVIHALPYAISIVGTDSLEKLQLTLDMHLKKWNVFRLVPSARDASAWELGDPKVLFPIQVKSRLPVAPGGGPLHFFLDPDGRIRRKSLAPHDMKGPEK